MIALDELRLKLNNICGDVRTVWMQLWEVHINGHCSLPSKHQEIWCEPCGRMDSATVSWGQDRNVEIPVFCATVNIATNHGGQRTIESLDKSIRAGLLGSHSSFVDL